MLSEANAMVQRVLSESRRNDMSSRISPE
jgi:hypothetical protein